MGAAAEPPPTDPPPTDSPPTEWTRATPSSVREDSPRGPEHVPPTLATMAPEVREAFRALSEAIGPNTTADREMLELWFTVITATPTAALQAYSTLTERYLPWTERRLVQRARQRGSSWSAIGRMLGRSRQAVQQRHDRSVSLDELLPPSPPRSTRRLDEIGPSDIAQARADHARQLDADEAERHGGVVAW